MTDPDRPVWKAIIIIGCAVLFMFGCLLIGVLCETVKADTAQLKGTTNTEDSYIDGEYPPTKDYNFGGAFNMYVDADEAKRSAIRPKNVASVLGVGATISVCKCSIYCNAAEAGDNTISAYRIFKGGWVEGTQEGTANEPGVTWNDWDNDDYEWTTAGCESADDGGSENSGDGTGADRKATAEDAVVVSTTGWYCWDISTDLAQEWYAGTATGGIILINAGDLEKRFITSESGDADYHPRFYFVYTTDGVEAPLMRRRKLLENLLQGEIGNEKNPFIFGSSGFAGWARLGLWDCQ